MKSEFIKERAKGIGVDIATVLILNGIVSAVTHPKTKEFFKNSTKLIVKGRKNAIEESVENINKNKKLKKGNNVKVTR